MGGLQHVVKYSLVVVLFLAILCLERFVCFFSSFSDVVERDSGFMVAF